MLILLTVSAGILAGVWIIVSGLNLYPFARTIQTSSVTCPTASGEHYDTAMNHEIDANAESNPEIVLRMRGWERVEEKLGLVTYGYPAGEPPDPRAPQLGTIVRNRVSFATAYRVHKWDWENRRPSPELESKSPVSLLGLTAKIGQDVYTPESGYDVGGGHQAMVIYASADAVTMNLIGDDNAIVGYAIHIDGFCVDPNLLALYRRLASEGRHQMPYLFGGEKIGTANSTEVRVAIRDSGDYLDPRSRLDWWKGYSDSEGPIITPAPIGPTQNPTVKPKKTPKPKNPTVTQVPTVLPTKNLLRPSPTAIASIVPTTNDIIPLSTPGYFVTQGPTPLPEPTIRPQPLIDIAGITVSWWARIRAFLISVAP